MVEEAWKSEDNVVLAIGKTMAMSACLLLLLRVVTIQPLQNLTVGSISDRSLSEDERFCPNCGTQTK